MKAAVICLGLFLRLVAACGGHPEDETLLVSGRLVIWSGGKWTITGGGCQVVGYGEPSTAYADFITTGVRVSQVLKDGKLVVGVAVFGAHGSAPIVLDSFRLEPSFIRSGFKDLRAYNVDGVPVRLLTWGGECSGVGAMEDPSTYLANP